MLDSRLSIIPQLAGASSYSGVGAYIFKDSSRSYSYFVNSSAAGYLWYWDERYPGIQGLGEGEQLRIHSNYGHDLKPEEGGFSVVYWEYEDNINYDRVTSSSGDAIQTILRNGSDFSLVKFTWSDSRMNNTLYYGFWSDRPYVWVHIERTLNQDMLSMNSQTCNMLSKNFNKFWWTDYTGQIVNWNYTGTPYRYTEPMFSALDAGSAVGYPFIAAYANSIDATVGFIYLDATSNIRKDTHIWGFELQPTYTELQVDLGGETDGGRRYWRQNTTMGLDYLVFLHSGPPNQTGNIIDYSKNLYNGAADVKADADPSIYSAAPQGFRNFSPEYGDFPVGLCGHTIYTATTISLQPRTYFIPYMDQLPLTSDDFLKESYYKVPLYSKWYFRSSTSQTLELDDQTVSVSINETIPGADSDIGMVGWDKGYVTAYSNVEAFRDSDKLLFYGNATLKSARQCLDSSFTLYFNNVNACVKISATEYDVRFIDPLFGWSGLYVKVDNGTIQQYSDRLEIRLFNYSTPHTDPAGTSYSYNFTLWGHPGNVTGITPFFTKQPLTYERAFSNYALGNSSFGFESMRGYVVMNSSYSSNQLTTYIMNLTNGQKTVWIFVRDKGAPENVTVNSSPVSFSYDGSTRIVSFNTVSSSVKRLVLSWPLVDSQPPSYSKVGYNTTLAKSPCQFYSLWQDNSGLSGYIFGTNNTGTWINDTWVSLTDYSAWANITKTLNSQGDLVIGYKWYCNDTSNNWNDTRILTLTTIWGDVQPPSYSNLGTNTTVASNPCQFSCYWQDNGGLSGYIFSTNNSGVWVNDTFEGLSGLAGWANKTKILNVTVGSVVGYRWYCFDSSNNLNDTGILTLTTIYSSKPQFSNVSYGTTEQNRPCVFSSFWTDDQALSGYIFGTNVTGVWVNDTFSALSGLQSWANKTKTLANAAGVRVEFQWWCNDSQDQWSTTGLRYLVTTPGQPPVYSNVGYNSTLAGNATQFSCFWQDSVGLSGYIFSTNNTGPWVNDTRTAINGLSAWSNVTKTLNSTVGAVVGFRWYCNDTDNNWNNTGTQTLTTSATIRPSVFGKDTIGGSQDTLPVGYVVACRFQAPANGTAIQISAYVRGRYGSGLAKAMIYSDVSGKVGTLLFESGQITLSSSWTWHNFSANYQIQSGSYYWFAVFASIEYQFTYAAGQTGQEAYAWGWTYPTVPTSFNGIYGPAYSNYVVSIYATYELPVDNNMYSLAVYTVGSGSVAKSPDQASYHLGDVVRLTATPVAGWSFSGWSGALSGSANPADLTVTGNLTVTATFIQNTYTVSVTVLPSSAAGTVTPNVSSPYHYGDLVVLTESPNLGYTFSGWSGDGSGTGSTRSVTVTGNMAVTATFIQDQYALTMYTIGQGSVVPGNQTFASGTVVDINAINAVGWTFAGWSGGASGSVNTTVTMNGPVSVTASFTSSAPAVFGKTTVGASTNTLPVGYVVACRFQAPTDGTATMVSAYVRARYQSGFAKIVVYSDNAGQAGNLLFESNQTSLSTGWAWQNFSINYKLQAGKYYWFTIFTSVESQFVYDAGETNQQAVAWGWSYPSVPAAFNGMYGPSYANRVASIYVTYTPDI